MRLCSQQKVWSTNLKKGRMSKWPSPAVTDDLLRRDITDLTEHPNADGKIFCCAIKVLFSNRIVGHAVSDKMTEPLSVTALRTALVRCESDRVVVQAD